VHDGVPADLVALDLDPSALTHSALRVMPVALTMTAGVVTYTGM
jgi:predicted amidohydrolase YtcJ